MKDILLRIPEETLESINHASNMKVKNRSQFIRDCINIYLEYFKRHEEPKLLKMKNSKDDFYKTIIMGR